MTKERAEHAVLMLRKVGIPDPETRMHSYPHQLSGGMAQRVTIAMALSNNPRLLIADEPTSGLDVTIQAQVLDLIQALVDELHSATILITRDLGIIAQHCEEVAVLYAGRVVERAPVRAFFRSPSHPYSETLIKAVSMTRQRGRKLMQGASPSIYDQPTGCALNPRCPLAQPICREEQPELRELAPGHFVRCHVRAAGGIAMTPIVQVERLVKHFTVAGSAKPLQAVSDVSFSIGRAETLGIVGESGSGKTTIGRCVLRLIEPTSGRILVDGARLCPRYRKTASEASGHKCSWCSRSPSIRWIRKRRSGKSLLNHCGYTRNFRKPNVDDRVLDLLRKGGAVPRRPPTGTRTR